MLKVYAHPISTLHAFQSNVHRTVTVYKQTLESPILPSLLCILLVEKKKDCDNKNYSLSMEYWNEVYFHITITHCITRSFTSTTHKAQKVDWTEILIFILHLSTFFVGTNIHQCSIHIHLMCDLSLLWQLIPNTMKC